MIRAWRPILEVGTYRFAGELEPLRVTKEITAEVFMMTTGPVPVLAAFMTDDVPIGEAFRFEMRNGGREIWAELEFGRVKPLAGMVAVPSIRFGLGVPRRYYLDMISISSAPTFPDELTDEEVQRRMREEWPKE